VAARHHDGPRGADHHRPYPINHKSDAGHIPASRGQRRSHARARRGDAGWVTPRRGSSRPTGRSQHCRDDVFLGSPVRGPAGPDVYDDTFGLYASAFFITLTLELGGLAAARSIDARPCRDGARDAATGDPYTAVASASSRRSECVHLDPPGRRRLTLSSRCTSRERVARRPDGDSFGIVTHCAALTYDSRLSARPPGRSRARSANDTPDVPSRFAACAQRQTVATSYDAGADLHLSAGFFDDFGRRCVHDRGTGGPVTTTRPVAT
jgi:hypothetical protein